MKTSFFQPRRPHWGVPRISLAGLLGAVVAFGMVCLPLRAQTPRVYHLGFETGDAQPALFIPADSQDKNCAFDLVSDNPHTGAFCARMKCDDFARFAVYPKVKVPLSGAGRYRISVWVRAGEGFVIQDGLPGFFIRLNIPASSTNVALLHILPDGRVSKNFIPHIEAASVPTTWTQVGAVVEIPANLSTLATDLFVGGGKGEIFVDDLSLEKVPDDTPLTPVLATN